jgi:hypothetical protein
LLVRKGLVAAALSVSVCVLACSGPGQSGAPAGGAPASGSPSPRASVPQTASRAIDLRVNLELLAGAHVQLLARTTGAGVGVRTPELGGYGAMVHENCLALTRQLAPQNPQASERLAEQLTQFDQDVLNYGTASFGQDQNGLAAARAALVNSYVPQMADRLHAIDGLPEAAGRQLLAQQAQDAAAVVDAQAKGDWNGAYAAVRTSYGHARTLAGAVAVAVARAQPAAYPGNPTSKAAEERSSLEWLLQEQAYLSGFVSSAAVGARTAEQQGAQLALQESTGELAQAAAATALGLAGQAGLSQALGGLQVAVVATAQATAARNAAAQQQNQAKLTNDFPTAYAQVAGAPLGASRSTATGTAHRLGQALANLARAEGERDFSGAASACREASGGAVALGDQLAAAIVGKAPDSFR